MQIFRRKTWKQQLLAWILVLATVFTSCDWPITAYAADAEPVAAEGSSTAKMNGNASLASTEEAQILGELEGLRSESSKQFLMDDGTISVVQYETDVHYLDENEEWQEIDNSLGAEEAEDSSDASGYTNKEGRVKFKFAKNPNANFLVRIMQGKYHIFFSAKDTLKTSEGARVLESKETTDGEDTSFAKQAEAANVRSGILYENLFAGTDVEYITSGSSLKENIVVKEKQDSYEYTFEIKTNHIEVRKEADGSISFVAEDTGELLYSIPVMYMWDAHGRESDAIEVEMTSKNKKHTLTIRADATWINAEERAFPVTIDPTLEATSTSTGDETRIVRNQYVAEGNPTVSSAGYGRGFLGYDGSGDETYRLFVQFKQLPTIPNTSVIANAKFYYAQVAYDHVGMEELTIAAKEVTESWTWGTKVNWNTQPSFASTILDYQVLSADTTGTYVGWDITKLIKSHYEEKDNTTNATSSFVLVGTEEGNYAYNHLAKADVIQENSAGYFSDAQPVLVITYRDTRGLEDYYTYQMQGLGKAGTAYIGDYTKELTVVKEIFSTNSTAIPFQLYQIYNSAFGDKYFRSSSGIHTKDYTKMRAGLGWKLNIQESIIEKIISGKKYLIYNDSDGTDHYFPLSSGSTYKDEDGLKLTVTKSTSPTKYTMTDEKGNQKIFHNGFLSTIMDANGNAIHLLYNGAEYSASGAWYANTGSTNQVTKIVQLNKGQSTPQVIAVLGYNDSGFLKTVTDHAGRTYQYQHEAAVNAEGSTYGYYLKQVTEPDGTYARYDYYQMNTDGSSKLQRTYDSETKLGGQYTYTVTKHNSKINSFSEIVWTSETACTQGRRIDVTNTEPLQVYYRDRGMDCTAGTADDIWTYMTFDNAGRTISQASMDKNRDTYYGTSATAYSGTGSTATANRIVSDVTTGTNGINLLKNGSAETVSNSVATGWTATTHVSSDTAASMTAAYDGSGEVRTGSKSFRITTGTDAQADADGNLKGTFSTTATLQSGVTYTFSGYFKNTGSSNFNKKSKVYLAVKNSSGTQIASGSVVNSCTSEQIEDGWTRLSVTFTPDLAGTYTLVGCTEWIYGTSCFDDFQLEEGTAPSGYNYLINGDSEWAGGWTYSSGASRVGTTSLSGSYATKITGNLTAKRTAATTIPLNISSDNTLVLSGWAKASSVAGITKTGSSKRAFGLEAILTYSDSTTETHYVSFDGSSSHLQFASLNIVPKKSGTTIKSIKVQCVYGKNANTAYFDNICLRKEPVACYKYDSEGNVVAVSTTDHEQVNFTYSAGNLIQTQSENEGTYDYTYDSKHNLTKVSNDGVDLLLTYDNMGHVKTTTLQNTSNTSNRTISTTASYSSDGNYLVSQTDALGATTEYTVNEAGILNSVTDALEHTTSYEYNVNNDRLNSVALEDGTSVEYVYGDGVLEEIVRNSLLPDGATKISQSYQFTYDVYDNVTSIRVGNRTLASYEYVAKNGPLAKITYGNGFCITYEHDVLGRVISEAHDGVKKYRYVYNSEGYLGRQEELDVSGNVIKAVCYEYDSLDRLIRSWEEVLEEGVLVRQLSTEHIYDTSNRLIKQSYQTEDGTSYSETYSYNSEDGTLESMVTASGETITYTYDYLKRLSSKWDGRKRVDYTYKNVGETGTSTQVESLFYRGVSSDLQLQYEYDALGNITKVIENGTTVAEYKYNEQSQLISEKFPQNGQEYTYDTSGNIQSRVKLISSWGTRTTYSYTDSDWKDLLTAVNGNEITYDAIGNPLKYFNDAGIEWQFTWKNGKELAVVRSEDFLIGYDYDADGMRTRKIVNGSVHNYTYLGGLLTEETCGSKQMKFTYNEEGKPYAIEYNGEEYYYVLNLQGDVICIVNAQGGIEAKYVYDAWGNLLSYTDSNGIGLANPLRYRGYYYDEETGFYYVSSRYYDPEIGRFINADTTDILTASPMALTDKNLYAYCDNNPVMRVDDDGEFWHVIVGAAVGFASQYVSNVVGDLLAGESLIDSLKIEKEDIPGLIGSSISGALSATGISAEGLLLANTAINSTSYIAECEIAGETINPTEMVISVGVGAAIDARGSGGINGKKQRNIVKKSNQYIAKSKSAKKIAMYTAKKVAVRKEIAKEIGKTFLFTIVANNACGVYPYVRRLLK